MTEDLKGQKEEDVDISLSTQALLNLKARMNDPYKGGEVALKNDLLAAYKALSSTLELVDVLVNQVTDLKQKRIKEPLGLTGDGFHALDPEEVDEEARQFIPPPYDLEQRVNDLEEKVKRLEDVRS